MNLFFTSLVSQLLKITGTFANSNLFVNFPSENVKLAISTNIEAIISTVFLTGFICKSSVSQQLLFFNVESIPLISASSVVHKNAFSRDFGLIKSLCSLGNDYSL